MTFFARNRGGTEVERIHDHDKLFSFETRDFR
jgi:hypothetical protein